MALELKLQPTTSLNSSIDLEVGDIAEGLKTTLTPFYRGPTGPMGPPGSERTGGTKGQVVVKQSNVDYDSTWQNTINTLASSDGTINIGVDAFGNADLSSGKTWTDYATKWTAKPTKLSTISTGDVFSYVYKGVTTYRHVPVPYVASNDKFYSSFVGGVLTNLLASRG